MSIGRAPKEQSLQAQLIPISPTGTKCFLLVASDPEVYEVEGDTVKFSSWDGANGMLRFSFKAQIRLKRPASHILQEDVYQSIRKGKKVKQKSPSGSCHFVVALSDWQVGNRDGGGMEEQARKIANLVDLIPQRIADLPKDGLQNRSCSCSRNG